jgi:hypothetical protein
MQDKAAALQFRPRASHPLSLLFKLALSAALAPKQFAVDLGDFYS